MKEVEFKVGDLVYCPSISPNVLEVLPVDDWQMKKKTPIRLPTINDNIVLFLTELGVDIYSKMPVIVHATQENYERLSLAFPNIEFEPPPKRKEPKEIIKAMLRSGKWHVINYRVYGKANQKPKNKVISKRQFRAMNYDDYFGRYAYCNVEVICPHTGKQIINFVNGEVVLEG